MAPNDLAILVVVIAFVVLCSVIPCYATIKREKKLQRYWDVEIGMTEEEMLAIMGKGYSRSLLKNGRTKYEWRIAAESYGTSHKGVSRRTYTGVRKVSIYTRNGCVEEVKPYNV